MIPAAIEIIEAMPLSPNGKIDKSKLNPTLEREGQKAQIAGSQNLAENLCRLWEDILDVPEIQLDDDFYDLGGHSLLAVEMADRIEHEFNSRIEITDLIGVSTVRQLADLLRKRTAAEADALSPVAVLKKGGAKPPLFCIPGIGGHLMRHMVLPAYLENDQPLYGIQATGYENDLDRFAQIEAIAFRYLSEIKSIQPEGPYYLVGTCFGGVVAYEMAAQLTRSGDTVALLVLVETRAPDRLIPSSMILLERLERFYGHMRSRFISAEANRPARQRKAKLVHAAELKDMRPGSNAQPNLELKKTLRAARKAYKPGRFSGKVILFKVRDSPYRRQVLDRRRPWKRVAGGGFKEVWIPGNHLSMLEEPLVRSLGEELSKYLRIAREHHAVFAKGGTYQATEARN
jgi:thioesterase domain-containing protein/acyl carrier protein